MLKTTDRVRTVSNISVNSNPSYIIQKKSQKRLTKHTKLAIIGLTIDFILFVVFLILYFIDSSLVMNGLIPCIISIFSTIPLFGLFWYFNKAINKRESQIEFLQQRISELQRYKGVFSQHYNQNNQNDPNDDIKVHQNRMNLSKSKQRLDLLQGFRNGQMQLHLENAKTMDLVTMLPLICFTISLLPFGMTKKRHDLMEILENKISGNNFVNQQFHFFLFSFGDIVDITQLFHKHSAMRHTMRTKHYYQSTQNVNGSNKNLHVKGQGSVYLEISANPMIFDGSQTPASPETESRTSTPEKVAGKNSQMIYKDSNKNVMKFPQYKPELFNDISAPPEDEEKKEETKKNIIVFDERDAIRFFRMAYDQHLSEGTWIKVGKKLKKFFHDPISGVPHVRALYVKAILHSNAKPVLIESYTKRPSQRDSMVTIAGNEFDDMVLCSTFLLKKGDDLRLDAAVMQMFRFMNLLWIESGLLVHALHYKCIPMGLDIGIIELIPNCVELHEITEIDSELMATNIDNLILKAAGSYIASFVLGIRDRHNQNILIKKDDCSLFHIDFGFLFGDKAGVDTAKLAITSDVKLVMDKYKENGWNSFVDSACDAWWVLRQNYNELLEFSRVLFGFLLPVNEIDAFFKESLKIDKTDEEAKRYMHRKLHNAPNKWKTKIKNTVHTVAQKVKS